MFFSLNMFKCWDTCCRSDKQGTDCTCSYSFCKHYLTFQVRLRDLSLGEGLLPISSVN